MPNDFTLEKMKIDERLRNVEQNQAAGHEVVKHIKGQVDKIHTALIGNGEHGLIKKVTILEHDKKNSEKHFFVVWVAVAGLAIKTAWSFIVKG